MRQVAKLVQVERLGSAFTLKIDGEEFPFALAADEPIETKMEHGCLAGLRFTLMADRVEFVDDPFPSGRSGDE